MENVRKNCNVLVGLVGVVSLFSSTVVAGPLSQFNAGMDGWTAPPHPYQGIPFAGNVEWASVGGNTDGYIRVIDTPVGPGGLWLKAPADFSGDFRGYSELRWDQFLFDPGSTTAGQAAMLIGDDGTGYRSAYPIAPIGVWVTRSVLLKSDDWDLLPNTGTALFEEVLADATLYIGMDVSVGSEPMLESGIDNVMLVPEPASLLLLVGGGLCVRKRRHRG